MDNDDTISPDNALEETNDPDYDTQAGRHEKLPEDNERPFSPADESPLRAVPPDHPATDSNLDEHQIYDEGVTNATEINAMEGTDEDTDQAIASS